MRSFTYIYLFSVRIWCWNVEMFFLQAFIKCATAFALHNVPAPKQNASMHNLVRSINGWIIMKWRCAKCAHNPTNHMWWISIYFTHAFDATGQWEINCCQCTLLRVFHKVPDHLPKICLSAICRQTLPIKIKFAYL